MTRQIEINHRSGPRYLVAFEVRAEWDEANGAHVLSEGTTENVGPEGTLVHLPRKLPDVGSRVRLEVQGEDGKKLQVIAEVLRIERNAGHPLDAGGAGQSRQRQRRRATWPTGIPPHRLTG